MQPSTQAAPRQASEQAAAAAPIEFLVAFRGGGPIARAQAQARRGQTSEGEERIRTELRRQSEFQGLCFSRFTLGAAEVVLRTCAAIVASERTTVQERWLAQLRGMRAVAYVDVNATATQNRAG
jgi:hypothetical protein